MIADLENISALKTTFICFHIRKKYFLGERYTLWSKVLLFSYNRKNKQYFVFVKSDVTLKEFRRKKR